MLFCCLLGLRRLLNLLQRRLRLVEAGLVVENEAMVDNRPGEAAGVLEATRELIEEINKLLIGLTEVAKDI